MNILHPITAFLKRMFRTSYRDPARDWIVLITLSFIALAGIAVWGAWAFDTVARGGVIGTVAPVTIADFDGTSLGTIHTVFDSRAAEEAKYVSDVYHFTDPSQ